MPDLLDIVTCGFAAPSPSSTNNSSINSAFHSRLELLKELQTELLPKIIDSNNNILSLKDSKPYINDFFSKHTTAKNYISNSFLKQIIISYQINTTNPDNMRNYQDIVSYIKSIK